MDKEARRSWHGSGSGLEFEPGDFEIVDLVLGQIPELRICAWALKRAFSTKLKFPITKPESLLGLFEGNKFEGGGHEFGPDDVFRYMPLELFPMNDEGEFVSRIYIALLRCKHEATVRIHTSVDVMKNQQVSVARREK
jgi:hypothetical protein